MRSAFPLLVALAIGLVACGGSGDEREPAGPPVAGRSVVVRFRSVVPGDALCGTATLAGGGGFACAGDSLAVPDVPEAAALVVADPSLVSYVEPTVVGDRVTGWLLPRERADVLVYVRELVNASGARPFPFGFRGARVAVLPILSLPAAGVRRRRRARCPAPA